jgi:hypothetical protein
MISPRHDEARKVAAVVRHQLKAEGAIGAEDHELTVLRRMDLGPSVPGPLTLRAWPGSGIEIPAKTVVKFRVAKPEHGAVFGVKLLLERRDMVRYGK